MVRIGRMNKLRVTRIRDYGAHLDGGGSGDVLLPKRYMPENCRPGDEIEVFVYPEGANRLRATTRKPYAQVGEFAWLRVAANSPSGSFMEWGLPKDLLVPRKEQHGEMEAGGSYVVYVFLDPHSNRITASTKLDRFLGLQPPDYKEGQEVDLLIYDRTELGYKAVVNNAHDGMLYKNEVFQKLSPGMQLPGYIKKIRADNKIDLRLQQQGYEKIDDVAKSILTAIKKQGGRIAVTDNSHPEVIYSLFGVSKKTFKKAVGALYRKRLVTLDADGIGLAARHRPGFKGAKRAG